MLDWIHLEMFGRTLIFIWSGIINKTKLVSKLQSFKQQHFWKTEFAEQIFFLYYNLTVGLCKNSISTKTDETMHISVYCVILPFNDLRAKFQGNDTCCNLLPRKVSSTTAQQTIPFPPHQHKTSLKHFNTVHITCTERWPMNSIKCLYVKLHAEYKYETYNMTKSPVSILVYSEYNSEYLKLLTPTAQALSAKRAYGCCNCVLLSPSSFSTP
jgi:hypothetical protein